MDLAMCHGKSLWTASAVLGLAAALVVPASVASGQSVQGFATIAVWRPSDGTWHIRGQGVVQYGRRGDQPVPADYNGDGRADIAVWRPSNGTWLIRGQGVVQYGRRGDQPVPADYNGDGRADIAVWRPSDGTWDIRGGQVITLGLAGDRPVPADYNAYSLSTAAVWRPSDASWRIAGSAAVSYGAAGDMPVVGDYNADGRADLATWRPTDGTWHISGQPTIRYGRAGDLPVPAGWTTATGPDLLAVRTLTFDGADVSAIYKTGDTIALSAPDINHQWSNLRKVFWPAAATASQDGQVCATWRDQSSEFVQEGVALRITTVGTETRAITVTKNVVYGAYWAFNVHTWNSASSEPFTGLGQYDMSAVVTNAGRYEPFPWRLCAKVTGAELSFKIWLPDREPEPDWTDPVHAVTLTVPAGYIGSGYFGWYVGHIPAGQSAHYNDLGPSA
jgi:FG-GAP-like repeat